MIAPDDPRHGTANAYNNLRCRCDRCRAAWAAYLKQRGDWRAYRDRNYARGLNARGKHYARRPAP